MASLTKVRQDRTVIIGIRPPWWALIFGLLLGCMSIWMGMVGITSPLFGLPPGVVRWVALAVGIVIVMAVPLLVISNVVQGWAVLVGSEAGLQVVYPLGLHRLFPRSRLEGKLDEAALRVLDQRPGTRLQAPLTFVRIMAPEGTLEFSFGASAANSDFEDRFDQWVATR